jgi:hypothetical protein
VPEITREVILAVIYDLVKTFILFIISTGPVIYVFKNTLKLS